MTWNMEDRVRGTTVIGECHLLNGSPFVGITIVGLAEDVLRRLTSKAVIISLSGHR